jgi:N-acetylneuraminic acid mutarotase
MYIFGGFVLGSRTNSIYKYTFQTSTWDHMQIFGHMPQKRSGHSAVVHGTTMVVFGGKDEENNKLNDIWLFHFDTHRWEEIVVEEPPLSRSGHSSCIYKDFLVIFGGIHEVTKELDDLHLFDFKNKRWVTMFEENSSPVKPL